MAQFTETEIKSWLQLFPKLTDVDGNEWGLDLVQGTIIVPPPTTTKELIISGDGDYEITFSGTAEKFEDPDRNISINSNDTIAGNKITGRVGGGKDGYLLDGTIEGAPFADVGIIITLDGVEVATVPFPSEGSVLPVPAPTNKGIILDREGATYELDRDISELGGIAIWVANKNITLKCNGHTIQAGLDGLAGPDDWKDNRSVIRLYAGSYDSSILGNRPGNANFKLIGPGHIIAGSGARNHGIGGNNSNNFWMQDNVVVEVFGDESQEVRFRSTGPTGASGCVFISHVKEIGNRHQVRDNVSFAGPSARLYDCIFYGGHSGGRQGGVLKRCVMMLNSKATNGSVWVLQSASNAHLADNVWLPYNGRGVLFDSIDFKLVGSGCVVENNVGMALELPNEEYPQGNLTPSCIKTRNNDTGLIQNNDFLVIGGNKWTSGGTIWLRNAGKETTHITGNTCYSVFVPGPPWGTTREKYKMVSSLGFAAAGTPERESNDLIEDNVLISNHKSIDFAQDTDAGFKTTNRPKLFRNELILRDGSSILAEWLQKAKDKLTAIGKIDHPLVVQRLQELEELFNEIGPISPIQPDAVHVDANGEEWDHPIYAEIVDSGEEPDIIVKRSTGTIPVEVTLINTVTSDVDSPGILNPVFLIKKKR